MRQLFKVDPKRIVVARNLVFFQFFFQFCFPKIEKLFLRNPNPNVFDERGVLNWAKALLINLSSIKNKF